MRGVHRVEDHVFLLLWQDKVHAGALPGTLRPHRLAYLQFCLSDQKRIILKTQKFQTAKSNERFTWGIYTTDKLSLIDRWMGSHKK